MKQTVEEAARDYMNIPPVKAAIKYGDIQDLESHIKVAFRNGAEWQSKQSPWISVEERLPEESLINPSAWSVTYKVFVLTSNGNASISQRRWNCNTNRWEWKGSGSFKDSITHWMPIPSFDDILEANRDVLKRIKEKGD